jgi:hypothetical protein
MLFQYQLLFGKQLKDELAKINISMIKNLIEINNRDQVDQIAKQIEYVLDYLNEDEDEAIDKELEERYKEEFGNFTEYFDAVLMSNYFEKMKIKLEISGFCIFHFYFIEMIDGFLYLLQGGDHRKHHYEIYKIGHSNDFDKRINKYIIDTQAISICPIDNEKKCEHELIRELKSEFELR